MHGWHSLAPSWPRTHAGPGDVGELARGSVSDVHHWADWTRQAQGVSLLSSRRAPGARALLAADRRGERVVGELRGSCHDRL